MESRIYPNWEQLEQLKNPLTDGERALLYYLDKELPRDLRWKSGDALSNYQGWLIFAQPFLNGLLTRGEITAATSWRDSAAREMVVSGRICSPFNAKTCT